MKFSRALHRNNTLGRRLAVVLGSLGLLGLTGCGWFRHGAARGETVSPASTAPPPIVTVSTVPVAQVIQVNRSARFVVLHFPSGAPLAPGHLMDIYRNGFKAAEVRISGPQEEFNTAADILSGEVETGDEARGQ